jgi:hypothetical protein
VVNANHRVRKLIPHDGFAAVSLRTAKDKILKDRAQLSTEFRYSNSTAVNDLGSVMQISSSSQDDNLSSDDGSMAAIDSFLASDGDVTGANVYAKTPDTEPQREIHLLLSGDINEFTVPVACSAGEYSYVRGKVISLKYVDSHRMRRLCAEWRGFWVTLKPGGLKTCL